MLRVWTVIPQQFPRVWLTRDGDAGYLDAGTVGDWTVIRRVFVGDRVDRALRLVRGR